MTRAVERVVVVDGTLGDWRDRARPLIQASIDPEHVRWIDSSLEPAGESLFSSATPPAVHPGNAGRTATIPGELRRRMGTVACFRSADVWDALYRVTLRIVRGERDLLLDSLDADVVRFVRMEKAVRRDAHKMHAFVRFRRVADAGARGGERFVAWYRPSHRIVERDAPFFQDRFPSMDWSILTPDRSAHWDGAKLTFTRGVPRSEAPDSDEIESLWCDYYASVFNPARVKLAAMKAEMPLKFWDTLPETRQIPDLLAAVPARLEEMARTSRRNAESAAPFVPAGAPLDELRKALPACEGCELHRNGTRAVFGEGPTDARIVLLGEQPGDVEERAGRPFVGPAGELLDTALERVGLDRARLYVTNAVKHFRHEPVVTERGKRRLHKRPTLQHASRCQPWLDAELAAIRPRSLVCLGVTAARTVFGPTFRMPAPDEEPTIRTSRYARETLVTFHPAAVLRARGREAALAASLERHIEETLSLAARSAT